MTELISVAEAQALMAEHMPSFGSERITLDQVAGRILRQSVRAEHDHPPFDRVMMDGIAVSWQVSLPRVFAVAGAQMAGMAMQTLPADDACIEVMTGTLLPAGCNCVIPIEQLRREGDAYLLLDGVQPTQGQFVHRRGSDCVAGTLLLESGMRIGAPEAALLAANGLAHVEVGKIPSIAIVSTGDELVDVDSPLMEGQIRRSNDTAIATALRLHGFDRIVLEHIVDDLAIAQRTLGRLLDQHDVLVLSGGVSMGQRDYMPAALDALGVRRVFHRIAQRPGKPMWFGLGARQQAVFALPGNPLSALVCAVRYVRPTLLASLGMAAAAKEYVRLAADAEGHAALTCFIPAYVRNDPHGWMMAEAVPARTSGDFAALPHTHGVVQLPPGAGPVPAGTVVEFYRW